MTAAQNAPVPFRFEFPLTTQKGQSHAPILPRLHYALKALCYDCIKAVRPVIVENQTGGVTFLQRSGSATGLHPHLHAVVPGGLFGAERVESEAVWENAAVRRQLTIDHRGQKRGQSPQAIASSGSFSVGFGPPGIAR